MDPRILGLTEESFLLYRGRAIKELGIRRSDLVISTKVDLNTPPFFLPNNGGY